MTGASGAASVVGSPLPKWQLALVVGAPVALGLGYMYYKNSNNKPSTKPTRGKSDNASKRVGTASADKQISIDVDSPPKNISPESETPLEKAQRFKSLGNDHFKMGKYDEAITQYNNAIEVCPKENTEALATFYQNRAAAYEGLSKYSAAKEDCTKALELKPKYSKALLRRARALEHCNDLESALEDVTAACILDSFSNHTALILADRVLNQLGRQDAAKHLASRKLVMPSKYFVKTYISTFQKDPTLSILQEGDNSNISPGFAKVLRAVEKQNYDDIIPLCTEEINNSDPNTLSHKMELLLLRATFYLILGEHDSAIEDFGTIINSDSTSTGTKVNALIKRATLYMQLEKPEKSFCDFDMAAELDPNCSDIYYQRGQVNLLLDKVTEAKDDFEKVVELNPKCGVGYVQKCYANYRCGMVKRDTQLLSDAIADFEKAFEKFPDCPECYSLYAQVLSETQEYQRADTFFAKGIEIDPHNASFYVHRGLLQLQWNSDFDKAVEYITKALEVDDKCEFGYETLGTIEVQRGNLKEAIQLYDKALALCRTTMELTQIFCLRNAAKTQLKVRSRLGADVVLNLQNSLQNV